MSLGKEEIFKLLYGQGPVERWTQDSPVLPDVWSAFARDPCGQVDVLLTPYQASGADPLTPGRLAVVLEKQLTDARARSGKFEREGDGDFEVAYNQTTVAARLYFDELVRVVLPLSGWWKTRLVRAGLADEATHLGDAKLQRTLAELFTRTNETLPRGVAPDILWTLRVIGTIAEFGFPPRKNTAKAAGQDPENRSQPRRSNSKPDDDVLRFEQILSAAAQLLEDAPLESPERPLVYLVSRNREASVGLWKSSAAVKADAARRLFNIDCSHIVWAIVDSGVDAKHPAFHRHDPREQPATGDAGSTPAEHWSRRSRVVATYDFTIIRRLLGTRPEEVASLPERAKLAVKENPRLRKDLRTALNSGREIDWQLITPLIRVPHDDSYKPPVHEHGTHVAGILAADWEPGDEDPDGVVEVRLQGICPDIRLYDLRVLGPDGRGDEFNVMAALQFLRYLNLHKDIMVVHGANLSLSIPHDVMNYACGRTPICEECERLVASGITIVAAAGNRGFMRATDYVEEGYRAISITDPGNADGLITVGSTHREAPHTYGVSFFSSRGPTGDGRAKPDLVAPGEKIDSCAPNGGLRRLDGTSMAAPHVSGAAALLMARHLELMGSPKRIKEILCRTATDLGRERFFQGNGMLDVLRALQSV